MLLRWEEGQSDFSRMESSLAPRGQSPFLPAVWRDLNVKSTRRNQRRQSPRAINEPVGESIAFADRLVRILEEGFKLCGYLLHTSQPQNYHTDWPNCKKNFSSRVGTHVHVRS
jgi:hypothetical protein